MDKEEMQKHINVLLSEEYIEDKDKADSVNFFKKAAENGEDISPAIETLKKAFSECNNVDIMLSITNTLVIYYIKKKQGLAR